MTPDPQAPTPLADPAGTQAWRSRRREELLERRRTLGEPAFRDLSGAVLHEIEKALSGLWGLRFGLYWPCRNEVGLFPLVRRMREAGGEAALRAPGGDGAAMRFRLWTPGDPLGADGGRPFPRDGPLATPDVVFVPLVGFDDGNFRLGYGGGSYDRLLTGEARPRAVGVGFEFMRLDCVRPGPQDVRLDLIVTEAGARSPPGGRTS